jgi:hypothetical protein
MGIPANLSKDEWYALFVRQCREYEIEPDQERAFALFDKGLTVNEAMSICGGD